jgi:hypothetical protein
MSGLLGIGWGTVACFAGVMVTLDALTRFSRDRGRLWETVHPLRVFGIPLYRFRLVVGLIVGPLLITTGSGLVPLPHLRWS